MPHPARTLWPACRRTPAGATAFACAMALALAACSSLVSHDEAFSGEDGQSYVLIAVDDTTPPSKNIEIFTFQRVDLASSTFLRELVPVTFHESSSSIIGTSSQFRRPETMARVHRFGGRTIPPGYYALVTTSHVFSSSSFINCHAHGATIYRFQEGAINIVPLGEAASRGSDVLLAQVAEVLKGYPGMTAPPVLAQQFGAATFDPGKTKSGQTTCNTNGMFSFIAGGAPAPARPAPPAKVHAAAVTQTSPLATWHVAAAAESSLVFVDTTSIARSGDQVAFRMEQHDPLPELQQVDADCASRSWAGKTLLPRHLDDGKVMLETTLTMVPQPGSVADAVMTAVCTNAYRSGSVAHRTRYANAYFGASGSVRARLDAASRTQDGPGPAVQPQR